MSGRLRAWARRTVLLLAVTLSLATLTGVARAQSPGEPGLPSPGDARGKVRRPPSPADLLERNADRLGLDEVTRAKIREIAEAARDEGRGLEAPMRALHDEMRRLLDQETPDLEAVLGQAERIGGAETELHKVRLRSMLKIRALLTPAQREELVRIHEEQRRERGHGPPPGAPPPPGPGGPPLGPPPDAW
jgi:Spy/CpxP family protein refolding chaperone